jgi:hypothetical protein
MYKFMQADKDRLAGIRKATNDFKKSEIERVRQSNLKRKEKGTQGMRSACRHK